MNKGIRYILAILLGVVAVLTTQFLLTKLWNLAGISWGPNNLPFELPQKVGMLFSAFIAGVIGPGIAVIIAKRKALIIIIAFLLIGLSIDIYASIIPLKPVALWFRIAWVISVPIQVYFGVKLGGLFIKNNNVQQCV